MAKEPGTKDNNQTIKIIIVVVLFGIMGYLIFSRFISQPDEIASAIPRQINPVAAIPGQQTDEISDLEKIGEYLDSLVKIGNWPIEYKFEPVDGDYGRPNPFLPVE